MPGSVSFDMQAVSCECVKKDTLPSMKLFSKSATSGSKKGSKAFGLLSGSK